MICTGSGRKALLSALLASAALSVASSAAVAADQIETVVVTGTMLHNQTASPVQVVTSAQIDASGLTSTADVIRSLSADNSGTIPTAFGNGFAAGASGVALRGLTVNSTLVLINGRRTANYPLADDGERGFVDLNTIPLDVVDHIDIVKDGASATYGADAIAGVVNIILKDSFQGTAAEAEVGDSQHGGGFMTRATTTLGYGDFSTDKFNVYVNLEYENDQQIKVGDRGFPFNTFDTTSIGGEDDNSLNSVYAVERSVDFTNPNNLGDNVVAHPGGCGPLAITGHGDANGNPLPGTFCEQNTALYGVDQPKEDRYGVYVHGAVRLPHDAEAYIDASYFENRVTVPGGPASIRNTFPHITTSITLPAYLTSGAANPNNVFTGGCAPTGTEGVTPCDDALIRYAFGDIPAVSTYDNHVVRATAGLKGDYWGWHWDAAVVAAHAWLDVDQKGLINYDQLLSDVADGSYNFLDPKQNTDQVRAALSPALVKVSTTDMDSVDVRVSRDVFALPGGPAELGLGVEGRHEATFDPDLNPNLAAQGLGIAHTIGSRNIVSAFAELGLPVTSTLDVNIAGRFDHYSDFGNTANPKVTVKWAPLKEIAFRGTWSTGFRAPSFSEDGSAAAEGFITENPGGDPSLCGWLEQHGAVSDGKGGCKGGDAYTLSYALGLLSSANPNIKPETSRNYTLGTVVTPLEDENLTLTVDYYNIVKHNVISGGDPAPALDAAFAGTAIPPGYTVVFDGPDPEHPSAPLRPLTIGSPYVNASALRTDGLDVELQAGHDLWDNVNWTTDLNFSYIFNYTFIGADGFKQQYEGTQAPYILSSGAGTPRARISWGNTVNIDRFSVTGTLYYTSGIRESIVDATEDPDGCDASPPGKKFCYMDSFWDFDLTGRYHITDQMDVFGSVKNVFDAKPPFDFIDYAGVNYNPTFGQAGIVGRFFSVGVSFKD